MKLQDWEQVKDLLHEVMQLPQEQRARFLDQACSSKDSLRVEVESLLRAEEDVRSSFLQSPPLDWDPDREMAGTSLIDGMAPGQVFADRFQLIRKLGEGGMGQVWLADQKEPVHRQVAVKLIKAGMDTREVIARFRSERQALALMDHPAIAKVFDAGSAPDGRPYFVMEYVPGLPITAYCDRNKLTVRQRLQLFILVCEGVQHAHQKAMIHRDLKPSNILVTEVDGKPMPRIIDFGVAKATAQQLSSEILFTRLGSVVGTLGYMSPEQADTAGQDIDTRSDVYSLGVVLYELLAGSLPLNFHKLTYDEALRRLREQDPPRPSTKIGTSGGESAATAQNRGVDAPALARQLRGDADAITLKALEKDRKRRYPTPSGLAADIERFLRNEPVTAHAPGAAYRARKYIRRHRTLAASVAAILFAALAAVWSYRRFAQRVPFQDAEMTQFTSDGNEHLAAISPDGRYVAYVSYRGQDGNQSLWVKQVSGGGQVQIVSPGDVFYGGLTFSRNGDLIYVRFIETQAQKNPGLGLLQRIPVLGGAPQPVIIDIDSPVTLSPDGRNMAFVRNTLAGTSTLIVVNDDGSGERTIAAHKLPDGIEGCAWSPDGKTIAMSSYNMKAGSWTLLEVPAAGGTERPLSQHRWRWHASRLASGLA
jgi:non-specific serine/threonine protein kinase/serine/threonine-protein kinase